jgi:outer membrane protein assembly factor BamD
MRGSKLSAAFTRNLCGICLVATTILAGCASSATDETAKWSNNKLYEEAKDQMAASGWDKAIVYFEKLEGRAAGTPLAQQAQLEKAYAQYKSGELAQAVATLDRFIVNHPSSPALDYAYYLKGTVNFNDNLGILGRLIPQDLAERDQKASKDSYEAFKQLVNKFPDSKYTPDARARMTYLVGSLARYEVHVAKYYYSRGAYVAAINRAQTTLKDYRDVPALEDALWILIQCYEKLGMKDLEADTRRIMERSYPNSAYTNASSGSTGAWWKLW